MKRRWVPFFLGAAVVVLLTTTPAVPLVLQSCSPPPPASDCTGSGESRFTSNDGGGGIDGCSPIIIDVSGQGFVLTSAENGVRFDITGTGSLAHIAWTAPGVLNAFLVFDLNNDGLINNGTELFGNFSPQPVSPIPNGFSALAEFDKIDNGGNADGIVDSHDAVFSDLRLWIDLNHDGISQQSELFKLPDLGVFSISLDYRESRRTDEYGNLFRYRSKINVAAGQADDSSVSKMAYDVFLTTQ